MNNLIEKLKNIETLTYKKPFSLLEMMYKYVYSKELVQSEMLAELLRRSENDGYDLIDSFLAYIDVNFELKKDSNLKIETERNANGRRIDIFISWFDGDKKHAVIIENKLNKAQNQPNQLNDYHDAIISEGYEIDKIVYLPLSKKWQKSEYTDTRKDVLAKTKNFDAQDIVDWFSDISEGCFINEEQTINYYETEPIWQYIEFLKCLISNQYIMQQVIEIQEKLSNEEIYKLEALAKIVNSKEWVEARFNKVSTFLKTKFENLQDQYFCGANARVQYWFKPYKFFVEIWIKEDCLWLLIVSESKEDAIVIANQKYDYDDDFDGYHYYCNDNYKYTDIEKLKTDLIPILQELSNYKEESK